MNLLKINSFTTVTFFSLLLWSTACQNIKNTQSTASNTNPAIGKPKEQMVEKPAYVVENQPYQPTKTVYTDLIHTKLAVSFDWQKQHMFGEAWLTLSPHFYTQNTVLIDAKGFDIHEVSLVSDGSDDLTLNYEYLDSLQLKVILDRSYSRNEKYNLYIKYTAKPNELAIESGSQAISDDKGLYFINPLGEDSTKPRQIWTQGETEASSCWFPTIDQPNIKTTEEIAITVDTNFVTLSNGIMEAQMFNDDGTRTDYWVQEKAHAPYLFMMAIGEFAVIYDQWLAPESGDRLEVNYYVEKEFAPYAKKIFGNTPEMMGFFSKKLGYEYPWDKYAQVVVRDYVSGAMENTSASIFMEALQVTDRELLDKNWDAIIAHELFHHWFGDLVTCESWGNLALNESFANYSEYLWYEYKYGNDYADAHRLEEIEGYLRESNTKQVPIVRSNYRHRMDMFDAHSYNKGGLVLHMLRNQIGDEAFFTSLKHYLNKNEFTDAELDELRLAFEEVTGEDLNWFFNQWFLSPGHPKLKIESGLVGDSLEVKIYQTQDSLYTIFFEIPTTLELMTADRDIMQFPIQLSGYETTLKLPLSKKPLYLLLDPAQVLLAEIEQERDFSENIELYKNGDKFQSRYDAIEGLTIDFANTNFGLRSPAELQKQGIPRTFIDSINTEILVVLKEALQDPSQDIRAQSLLILKGYDLKQIESLLVLYKDLAVNDMYSKVRAAAISNIAALTKKGAVESETETIFLNALKDSSYMVVGEALMACATLEVAGSDEFIKQYENSDKANIIKAVGKYYLSKGDSTKAPWIIKAFNKSSGGDLISLIDVFASLTKIASDDSKQILIDFYFDQAVQAEDIYTRYTAYRILHALDKLEGVRAKRQEVISKEKSTMLLGVYSSWEKNLK